jgi:hypothetical protein
MNTNCENILSDHEKRISSLEEDRAGIEAIKLQIAECEKLHQENQEHNKRNDDALKHNTESNLLTAKAVNELNITLKTLSTKVEEHEPVVQWYRPFIKPGENLKGFFLVNKWLVVKVGGAIIFLSAVWAAIQSFL